MNETELIQRIAALTNARLDGLAEMPCRVDEMTERELTLFNALIPAVAALQTISRWIEEEAGTP